MCLAKCLDRAYDYLQFQKKNINPNNEAFVKKYITKMDGNNLLRFND